MKNMKICAMAVPFSGFPFFLIFPQLKNGYFF